MMLRCLHWFKTHSSFLIPHSFVLLLLVGCAELEGPTATPVVPTAPPAATAPPPSATPFPPTATFVPPEATTTLPPPPTATATPFDPAAPTATPTFAPNSPALESILESSFARMAALPGYAFTATVEVQDFSRIVNTQIEGAYARPNRLHWTTTVSDGTTEAVIVGEDYFVSLGDDSWTQVPNAVAALDQYRLWTTLRDAVQAEVHPRDDPDSPLAHLGYTLIPAHLPLPLQAEPWRLISVGVWIGREDQLLHRIDLAAQTANYLLEEHMYFFDFGIVPDIQPPAIDTQPPSESP
jgi:hypothetical protein